MLILTVDLEVERARSLLQAHQQTQSTLHLLCTVCACMHLRLVCCVCHIYICACLLTECMLQLNQYPTTIEDDDELLREGRLDPFSNRRHAVIVIRGEKEICHFLIQLHKVWLSVILFVSIVCLFVSIVWLHCLVALSGCIV